MDRQNEDPAETSRGANTSSKSSNEASSAASSSCAKAAPKRRAISMSNCVRSPKDLDSLGATRAGEDNTLDLTAPSLTMVFAVSDPHGG
jgi:hypothetical protein